LLPPHLSSRRWAHSSCGWAGEALISCWLCCASFVVHGTPLPAFQTCPAIAECLAACAAMGAAVPTCHAMPRPAPRVLQVWLQCGQHKLL
jgi:hypothetical protein